MFCCCPQRYMYLLACHTGTPATFPKWTGGVPTAVCCKLCFCCPLFFSESVACPKCTKFNTACPQIPSNTPIILHNAKCEVDRFLRYFGGHTDGWTDRQTEIPCFLVRWINAQCDAMGNNFLALSTLMQRSKVRFNFRSEALDLVQWLARWQVAPGGSRYCWCRVVSLINVTLPENSHTVSHCRISVLLSSTKLENQMSFLTT